MKTNKQPERLQKVIASSGFCSRRKAEELILAGRVRVNKEVVTALGTKVTSDDVITVDKQVLQNPEHLYFAFYKPINCLTTLKDPKHRPTIMRYFSDIKTRIYPVGRLDFDTTGLLLMTNDGEFSNQILHPRYKINKVYQVTCQGLLSEQQIKQLVKGVQIDPGVKTAPAKVRVLRQDAKKQETLINLTIHQGYKNQVKKMLQAVGSKVLKLERIAVGSITLKGLQPGAYRPLTIKEKQDLLTLANNK